MSCSFLGRLAFYIYLLGGLERTSCVRAMYVTPTFIDRYPYVSSLLSDHEAC